MSDPHPKQGVMDARLIANLGEALYDARNRHADATDAGDELAALVEEGSDLLEETSEMLEKGIELMVNALAFIPREGIGGLLRERIKDWMCDADLLVGGPDDEEEEEDDEPECPQDVAPEPDTAAMPYNTLLQPFGINLAQRQMDVQDEDRRYRRILEAFHAEIIDRDRAEELLAPFLTAFGPGQGR